MKLNRAVLRKTAGSVFLLFVANSCFAYNWPFKEGGVQTVEQKVRQTVCAWRSGSRFHRGLDICPNDTANIAVYAVNSDTAYWYNGGTDNEEIVIGEMRYIHIDADSSLNGTLVNVGDSLGIIFRVGGTTRHLHLQEGSSPPGILNPLFSLTPFTDTYSPVIDANSIEIYDQATGSPRSRDSLRGKVDIDVMSYDTLNHSISELLGRVYPCSLRYQVLDTLGNPLKDTVKVRFDKVPPNVNVDWLLRSTNNIYPTFRITNTALDGDTVRDHYWNTKQKDSLPPLPDSVDAESVDVAKFPRGNYWVKVFAYDTRGNSDAESVQVYVDNFGPRVDSVFPVDGATNVPIGTKIRVKFDEPMDQSANLRSLIEFSPGASVSWQWVDSTKIRGTPNPSLEPGTNYSVTIHATAGSDSLTDIVGHPFDGDRNGEPGGDFQWSFETGDSDTTSGWPIPPQWDGASENPNDSVVLEDPGVDHLTYFYPGGKFFPFCGEARDQLDVSESGSIWFHGSADNTHHFYLPSANGHPEGVLAVHNDAIEILPGVPWPDFRGKIYVKRMSDPERVIIEWWIRKRDGGDTTNFEAVLFDNGWIRYDYKLQNITDFYSDGGSGISCGDDTHYVQLDDISHVAPASYMFGPNVPPGGPANMEPMLASVGVRWDQNPESDLKGYYVYRASGADTTDTASLSRLCDTLITDTTYADESAEACSTYWYAVSAADTFWFEGAMSNKVVGTVPPIPGATPNATAYNTGRKIVKDKEQLRFYVTYVSTDSIRAAFTDCEGCLWDIPYGVGEGRVPAIAVNDSNRVWVVWVGGLSGEVVFYSKFDGVGWTSPDTLFDFQVKRFFGSLSFAMDNSGYGNVLVDEVHGIITTPPVSFSTFLIRFDSHREPLQPWVTTIRSSSWEDTRSSIDCDGDGNLHVAWDEGDVISYRKGTVYKDTVSWDSPQVISNPVVPSKFPCIEHSRDSLSVVWQAQAGVSYQISHRRKALEDTLWLSIERVDSTTTENTYHPVITGGSYAVWAQELSPLPITVWTARREGTSWTHRKVVKGTAYDSRFPHAVSYQGDTQGYLLVCWTEDIEGPGYGVDNVRLQASSLLPTASTSAQLLKAGSRPRTFSLSQNAPNPFALTTRIAFAFPRTEDVVLDIYNVAGQRVRRLVNGRMKAGRYEMVWDGTDEYKTKVGSGTYFAKLVAGSFQKTRKMILIR